MSGDLFFFVNESRKLCKVLVWDGNGLCIFQRRLERGCFAKLWREDGQVVKLTQSELALFIEAARVSSGPTEQPRLPIVEQIFHLDAADRTCPSCGGESPARSLRELPGRRPELGGAILYD